MKDVEDLYIKKYQMLVSELNKWQYRPYSYGFEIFYREKRKRAKPEDKCNAPITKK